MSRPVKVTPALAAQARQLRGQGQTKREVAAALGISMSTVKRLTSDSYGNEFLTGGKTPSEPFNAPADTSVAPAPQNASEAVSEGRSKKLAPTCLQHAEAVPEVPSANQETLEEPMLLQNQALTPDARRHFGLSRNPFVDDVQSGDDVFQTASVRYVRASLLDAAMHHGFIAIVGESGAGKSTLAEDLEERIRIEGREIVVIRPYVLAMEENDSKGKTLKSGQMAEAVIRALDPQASVRSSPEARFRQVHELLRASSRAGRRHLLLIEEAHCLPTATLKHLKRWLEVKDGLRRLIGVALVGQPELRARLSNGGAEVREVAQRCELVELGPLDADLEGYLRHKFARFALTYEQVFAPDAADAIRARLIHLPRGARAQDARSICYPLVVNNLVSRAMNAATAAGYPVVDAAVIGGC